jgi:hypothetical protein
MAYVPVYVNKHRTNSNIVSLLNPLLGFADSEDAMMRKQTSLEFFTPIKIDKVSSGRGSHMRTSYFMEIK